MRALILLFIRIHYLLNHSGIRLKGLGAAQRILTKDFIFRFNGLFFFYNPSIEGSYDYLLIGKPNEPETHLFLDKIIRNIDAVNFIDVGASVGEFAIGVSIYENIKKIYAFEPRPDCAEVLRRNKELNSEKQIEIFEYALDDKGEGHIELFLNAGGSASGIFSQSAERRSVRVKTSTLDNSLPSNMNCPILLIDVEGAEPLVIKGGINFIKNNRPLIIFEYNNTSRQHFNVSQIIELLGSAYKIFRLNQDGSIDNDLSKTWNCVAIPSNSIFSTIVNK
jgi:FkbM family methyltransferase